MLPFRSKGYVSGNNLVRGCLSVTRALSKGKTTSSEVAFPQHHHRKGQKKWGNVKRSPTLSLCL